jgi:hypothetical protein
MNGQESGHGSAEAATIHEDGKGVTVVHGQDRQEHTFTFDHCFGPDSKQDAVYDATGRPIVEDVLEGYYGTVFAYGQTGSGKTFTMEGVQVGGSSSLLRQSAAAGSRARSAPSLTTRLTTHMSVFQSLCMSAALSLLVPTNWLNVNVSWGISVRSRDMGFRSRDAAGGCALRKNRRIN